HEPRDGSPYQWLFPDRAHGGPPPTRQGDGAPDLHRAAHPPHDLPGPEGVPADRREWHGDQDRPRSDPVQHLERPRVGEAVEWSWPPLVSACPGLSRSAWRKTNSPNRRSYPGTTGCLKASSVRQRSTTAPARGPKWDVSRAQRAG